MAAQSMSEFLPVLRNRDVHIWAGGEQLHPSALDGVLTLDLRAQLLVFLPMAAWFISCMPAIAHITVYLEGVLAEVTEGDRKEGEL